MKAPNTIAELKAQINAMEHRERICYPASAELKRQIQDAHAVEIYSTELFESKHGDTNVNIKVVDICGKPITADNGKALVNKSKYLRLFREEYYQSIFSIIQGNISEGKAITQEQKAIVVR